MRDLTKGPVHGHVLQLSTFIALTTFFQTLYFLVDLYFVGRLGKEAIAGVGLAGTLTMVVLALTQTLGVGATSLIAQSLGRRQRDQAERFFNQAIVLSNVVGMAFGVAAFASRRAYASWLSADAVTATQCISYLGWFVPALTLQFALVALGAALRGMGDLKVPTLIQIATVLINIVLAPVLMFGWGTGVAMGVSGASLASFIAIAIGCIAFLAYFAREASPLHVRVNQWSPDFREWWHMLRVGLPVGGEFLLMSVYLTLVYDIIRPFGAAAQAGFGIGVRVMQSLFLPAVAIGFATAPVAGQNFGARLGPRVRQTFYSATMISVSVMVVLTIVCWLVSDDMVRIFNNDPAVITFGTEYLHIVSWNFVASGIVFVTSSMFQGMGNTLPSLGSSVLRLFIFAVPGYMLAQQPGFRMSTLWYISVASVLIQVTLAVWLLHREFDRKLTFTEVAAAAAAPLPEV
ncbi:MAG TPA: MATE family efflux transporter [Vicinamibacterales bacterium]|nr:MATE family efflux transporter [Vicinamibacterales bacterium]